MKRLLAALVAAGALYWSLSARSGDYDPSRDVRADLRTASAQARAEGKRVLLEVGSDTCVWCDRLHRFIAEDAEVRASRDRGFVTVTADLRSNGPFWAAYPRIPGTPHYFVLDADGRLLHSQDTGQLESGSTYDRAKLLEFFAAWSPRAGG